MCVPIMSPIPHSPFAQGTAELSEQELMQVMVSPQGLIEMAQFMAAPGMIGELGGEGSDLNWSRLQTHSQGREASAFFNK